jgi:hypothetical protein
MSKFRARALRQPASAGPAAPRPGRSVEAKLEARSARERSNPKAVEAKGSASPIRAWRAADADPALTAREAAGGATRGHPFGGDGSGPRRTTTDRAARMRAIEQAWKDERARQAELEDD